MTWKIALEKAVPFSGAPHYWHCRIDNDDLGVCTANDGDSPEIAVLRAREHIAEQVQERMAEMLRQVAVLYDMDIQETPAREDT